MNDEEVILAAQRETRWTVIQIEDPAAPGEKIMMYTTGLTKFDRPELVVVGVAREIRNQVNMLVNLVGARSLVEALIPGEVYRLELGNGMDLLVTEVDPHDPRYVLEYALGVYGDRVRALLVEPLQPGVE